MKKIFCISIISLFCNLFSIPANNWKSFENAIFRNLMEKETYFILVYTGNRKGNIIPYINICMKKASQKAEIKNVIVSDYKIQTAIILDDLNVKFYLVYAGLLEKALYTEDDFVATIVNNLLNYNKDFNLVFARQGNEKLNVNLDDLIRTSFEKAKIMAEKKEGEAFVLGFTPRITQKTTSAAEINYIVSYDPKKVNQDDIQDNNEDLLTSIVDNMDYRKERFELVTKNDDKKLDKKEINEVLFDKNNYVYNTIDNYSYQIKENESYLIYSFTIKYNVNAYQENFINSRINLVVKKIAPDNINVYEKEKAIHDYIVSNFIYDANDKGSLYNLVKNGVGNSRSFSLLGQKMLEQIGIKSIVIKNKDNSHYWLIIRLYKSWYHLDLALDNPEGQDVVGAINYDFYNLNDNQIATKQNRNVIHSWDRKLYPATSNEFKKKYKNER